ncbi:hypothetical protein Aduo_001059 [Ancylostoma duodenale]
MTCNFARSKPVHDMYELANIASIVYGSNWGPHARERELGRFEMPEYCRTLAGNGGSQKELLQIRQGDRDGSGTSVHSLSDLR